MSFSSLGCAVAVEILKRTYKFFLIFYSYWWDMGFWVAGWGCARGIFHGISPATGSHREKRREHFPGPPLHY